MDLESPNPDYLDLHPDEQALVDAAQASANFKANAPEEIKEEGVPVLPEFRLIVGMEYVLAGKITMKVIHEVRGLFIGVINMSDTRPLTQWYLPDGTAERDLDKFPEQDPFDVVRINKAPDVVYLLRDNFTLAYSSNNCFLDRDAAVKAAVTRKLQIVAFKEVMDD